MAVAIVLSGKNALITGGTRGIGKNISLRLAQAGARVCMSYRTDASSAEETLAEIEAVSNVGHFVLQADISVEMEARRMAHEASERFGGKVDIAVLNAGIGGSGPLSDVSIDAWRKPFEANLFGHVVILQTLADSFQVGGSVVAISSGSGHDPIEGLSAYGASKAAINQMMAVLAQEWGPRGIRGNVVSPGSTAKATVNYEHLTDSQKETVAATALRRLGTADDVADAVLFFASELSSFVTGQWLRVNGGRI